MRDYPQFPDLYAVTEDGRIWSKPRLDSLGRDQGNKFLKPKTRKTKQAKGNGNLYSRVTLSVDGKYLDRYVHQMVAETYLGKRPDGLVIDHVNGNHLNNNATNLEYVTRTENIVRCGPYFQTLRQLYKTRCYSDN